MGPHVYVAASSREIPRARDAVRMLDEAGCVGVAGWIEAVEKFGTAGACLTDAQRADCAAADLRSIDGADAILVLWPETPSIGAYVELGYALGRTRNTEGTSTHVLIVGGDSIWHSLVRDLWARRFVLGGTFATVEEAIEWMRHEMHVCGEWPDAETVERMNREHETKGER